VIKKSKIEIIIPTVSKNKNLLKVLKSISEQNLLPNKIIIVCYKKIKIKKFNNLNIKIVKSDKKNQVYQRTIGLKYLSKNCKILLQLDDRVILEQNAIYSLTQSWLNSSNKVVGIGLNPIDNLNDSGIFNFIFQKIGFSGKILVNGYNIGYKKLRSDLQVSWLMGGLSSWRLDKVKKIYNRKFPFLEWSVAEDVLFSLGVSQDQKLNVCHLAKVSILQHRNNIDIKVKSFFNRGYLHIRALKKIVFKINGNLPLLIFSTLLGSFIQIIFSLILLKKSQIFFNFGKLRGLISN